MDHDQDKPDTKEPSLRERYMARRREAAERIEKLKKTDPVMAESARRMLFPDPKPYS
jgi:hypothetical protein